MKLAIISHTPHYVRNGKLVGWGPTVREINHLTEIFDRIYHIAPLHKADAPESTLSYESDKIEFIPLKPYGGERLSEKFSVITTAAHNLKKIGNVLNKVDWVQFRAPTAMGIYVLPYLSLRASPKKWFKYAGNWIMENPPITYRFQKWWLENMVGNSKVTVNGNWINQKKHILNFQNPCLDTTELRRAKVIAENKVFSGKLTLCFVGSLTRNKGAAIFLESLSMVSARDQIREVIIAGDGPERKEYEKIAKAAGVAVSFRGFVSRKDMEKIYEDSHLIILPSESEGFPKVIAEAAAYGCVPVVSDVSSIGQYFNASNGYLLNQTTAEEIAEKIDLALGNRSKLKEMSENCRKVGELFTFENYNKNLTDRVLSDNV